MDPNAGETTDWKATRCLVTGGASFIGSHLVEALLGLGATVRVADDLSSGSRANLDQVGSHAELIEGDLKHVDLARKATGGCHLVFHLAAAHGGRGYIDTHPASCAANMALDNIVFEAAAATGVDKITFASSACVYPTDIQTEKQLLHEDMVDLDTRGGAFADEEYGWAKLMGELSLRAHHKQYGTKAAVARISSAYGPRENESHAVIALVAKAFIEQSPYEMWGDGSQTRGFTYVDDVVDGIIGASVHIDDTTAVNVGTADFVSLNEVAEEVFDAIGWRPPDGVAHQLDRPVGVRHRALDGSRARQVTGWSPTVALSDGIARTVAWYVDNRDPREVRDRLDARLMER